MTLDNLTTHCQITASDRVTYMMSCYHHILIMQILAVAMQGVIILLIK